MRKILIYILLALLTGGILWAAEPVRVMSFNLRYGTAEDGKNSWKHRRNFLAAVIETFGPQVLGTQECLAFQAEFLQKRFPHFSFIGVGRDDGARQGEMTALFLDSRRFQIVASGHFWLSQTPGFPGRPGWDAALPRLATWVRLKGRGADETRFCVINTHLDHQGSQSRIQSARLLGSKLKEVCAGDPALVLGDFNAPADPSAEGPYQVLTSPSGPGLLDAHRSPSAGSLPQGTYHAFTGRPEGGRIDWILHTPDWRVLSASIDTKARLGRYPSDHFPVTAILQYLSEPAESR